jgi:5-methylcytosine-specific restriction enzyme A
MFIEEKIELDETEQTQNILSVNNADTLENILKLEKKMLNLKPRVRERISVFIERGSISSKIKKLTGFKCLICEKLGQNPFSFQKTNGEYYIETHHVEPVANLKKGSLGVANLLTLCANHHRQMHYGNVQTIENTDEYFKFRFDDKELIVNKIKIK